MRRGCTWAYPNDYRVVYISPCCPDTCHLPATYFSERAPWVIGTDHFTVFTHKWSQPGFSLSMNRKLLSTENFPFIHCQVQKSLFDWLFFWPSLLISQSQFVRSGGRITQSSNFAPFTINRLKFVHKDPKHSSADQLKLYPALVIHRDFMDTTKSSSSRQI